jgi:hypothetical protein
MRGPSLLELRARVHKAHYREIGNALACRWGRPSAVYGTWAAVRLGLSAHQVTGLALASIAGSAVGLGWGTPLGFATGVLLGFLAFWLDHVDGQVARWRGTAGLSGVYLDYLMHHAQALAVGFGLGLGLAVRTGWVGWTVAGFLAGCGWLFLSIQNDCRYKAMFQRLKVPGASYRVETGSFSRPAPAAGWPRIWPGIATWPAFKLCEPHVVLMTTAVLGVVGLASEPAWVGLVGAYTGGMAVLAPALAVGRIARAVRSGAVESEFGGWFREERTGGATQNAAMGPTSPIAAKVGVTRESVGHP